MIMHSPMNILLFQASWFHSISATEKAVHVISYGWGNWRQSIVTKDSFTNKTSYHTPTKGELLMEITNQYHFSQSLQPIKTRLNWQTTNNIPTSLTNQINSQRIQFIPSTNVTQPTWLWWRLLLRLWKCLSVLPQTVRLRLMLTQTIMFH